MSEQRHARTLRGNALAATVSNLVRGALALVASVVVNRALGPSGRGEFALVTNAVLIVVLIGGIGMSPALIHARAKLQVEIDDLFAASAALGLGAGLLGAAAFAALAALGVPGFAGLPAADVIWIVVLSGPLLVLSHWTAVAYLADRVADLSAAVAAGGALFLLGVALIAATAGLTPLRTITLWALTSLVPIAILLRRRRLRISMSLLPLAMTLVRFSLRAGFATLALILTWRVDVFLVRGFRGLDELGEYTAAVVIAEAMLQVLVSLRIALAPFQGSTSDRDRLVDRIASVCRLLVPLGLLATVSTALAAQPLVTHLYGWQFAAAGPAITWLVPGIFALVVQGPLIDYLITEGRMRAVTYATATAMVINIALDVWLLRDQTFVAAAVASTVAYLLSCALVATLFLKETGRPLSDLVRPRSADLQLLAAPVRRRRAVERRSA
jgi:antigen flippase